MKFKLLSGLALTIAVSSMALLVATDAVALPSQSYRIQYFANPDYSDPVGTETLACNGHYTLKGETSPYSILLDSQVCDLDPPGGCSNIGC